MKVIYRYTRRGLALLMALVMIVVLVGVGSTFSETDCHPEHDETCGYVEIVAGVDCSHEHDELCEVQEQVLTCTGAEHECTTDACFDLECDEEEYQHTELCYKKICDYIYHMHDDECEEVICLLEEHECTETCIDEECMLDQHEHTSECQRDACTREEHEHEFDCFRLDCEETEYQHTEACFTENCAFEPCLHEDEECYGTVLSCSHEHDGDCGFIPEVEGVPCSHICEICEDDGEPHEHDDECICETETDEHEESCPLYTEPLPECDCGAEFAIHDETCPRYMELECVCGETIEGYHDYCCPLFDGRVFECGCEEETGSPNEHVTQCPLYDGPYCECGNPGGPHEIGCPRFQSILYADITAMIDALPSLEEVKAMDFDGVLEARDLVYAVRDAIIERVEGLSGEECARFDEELGVTRRDKYNSLMIYIEEFIYYNTPRGRSLALATSIDISLGWLEVRSDRVIQHINATGDVRATHMDTGNGFKLQGTWNTNYAGNPIVFCNPAYGSTMPTLYFDNLNISNDLNDCVNVTACDVTIILVDGTVNSLVCRLSEYGGALVKDDATDGRKLYIYCMGSYEDYLADVSEHMCKYCCIDTGEPGHTCTETSPTDCGKLSAIGEGFHIGALGASHRTVSTTYKSGFANLYIKGGIITVLNNSPGSHSPGIGSMCGNAFAPSIGSPQTNNGQICRDIYISGGRVYAYGGGGCAGIGSGAAGPVGYCAIGCVCNVNSNLICGIDCGGSDWFSDCAIGIYISDGAYVYAVGGQNSPGIGSGGTDAAFSSATYRGFSYPSFNVYNINISGGKTIVEAVGSTSIVGEHMGDYPYVPGIGCGIPYLALSRTDERIAKNIIASPETNWWAMVRQGTAIENSQFINGTPSLTPVDIIPDMFYTYVRFEQMPKSAFVNGIEDTGAEGDDEVNVNAGDRIEYVIDIAEWFWNAGEFTVVDIVPGGMTVVTTPGTYTEGMRLASRFNDVTGVYDTIVIWDEQLPRGEDFGMDEYQIGTIYRYTVAMDAITESTRVVYSTHAELYADNYSPDRPDDVEYSTSNKPYHYTYSPVFQFITKVISNLDELPDDLQEEMKDQPFVIRLSGDASGSVILKDGEESGAISVRMSGDSARIRVTEIMAMEFDPEKFEVWADIYGVDGNPKKDSLDNDLSGDYTDRDIIVEPGDVVYITVRNIYDPQPYFKASARLTNVFENEGVIE